MEGTTAAPSTAPNQTNSAPSQGDQTPQSPQKSGQSSTENLGKTAPNSSDTPSRTSQPDTREYKINGKMVKMTQKEADDYVSMSYAANERFNEAKKLRGDVDKIIKTAKSNPIEALMDPALGLSKDQIRDAFEKWYHQEYIEPQGMSEEQKKIKEYETKLKKYEEEEKQAKLKQEQEHEAQLTNREREYLQNQIVEAMEASGLPKTKFFASRMAFYMRQNALNGWDAPIDLIVKQVKQERQSIMSDLSEGSSVEQLVSMLGEGAINKIRKYDLEQLRKRRQGNVPDLNTSKTGVGPDNGERLSSAEVTKRLRDIRLGKI